MMPPISWHRFSLPGLAAPAGAAEQAGIDDGEIAGLHMIDTGADRFDDA